MALEFAQGSLNLKLLRLWVPAGKQETSQVFQSYFLAPCGPPSEQLAQLDHSPAVTSPRFASQFLEFAALILPPLGRAHGALEFPGLV